MSQDGVAAQAAALKDAGNAKFKSGDYEAAVKEYTRSLELDPQQHLVYSNRSGAYVKLGKSALALQDAEKCVEIDPNFAKGYSRQATALQELKLWDEAMAACEKGLTVATEDAQQSDTLKKMLVEAQTRRFKHKLQGTWHGTVNPALGGYDQEMEFVDESSVKVEVLGRSATGKYWLDIGHDPVHLNIQVRPPDMPMEHPDPPPVPYITRLDDAGLHLCCPYKKMERPTQFEGPGYCLMKKGAFDGPESTEMTSLTLEQKLLKCTKEVAEAMPNRKLEEVRETDSEDVLSEKVVAQVKFETAMFRIQRKYGEDTVRQVIEAAGGRGTPPAAVAGLPEWKELQDKMRRCGMLEEAPPPPSAPTRPNPRDVQLPPSPTPEPMSAPSAPAEPSSERRAPEGEKTQPTEHVEVPAVSAGMDPKVIGGAAVAVAMAAIAILLVRRQKKS